MSFVQVLLQVKKIFVQIFVFIQNFATFVGSIHSTSSQLDSVHRTNHIQDLFSSAIKQEMWHLITCKNPFVALNGLNFTSHITEIKLISANSIYRANKKLLKYFSPTRSCVAKWRGWYISNAITAYSINPNRSDLQNFFA